MILPLLEMDSFRKRLVGKENEDSEISCRSLLETHLAVRCKDFGAQKINKAEER